MRIRNQHIMGIVVLLVGAATFIMPARLGDGWRMTFQSAFWPVASPTRRLGIAMVRAFESPPEDPRSADDIRDENARLRAANSNLQIQLQILQQRLSIQDFFGEAIKQARPFAVASGDGAHRDVLNLRGGVDEGLAVRQAAIRQEAVVGRIWRVGNGSAQVRLITDVGARLEGAFGRWEKNEAGQPVFRKFEGIRPLVEGMGDGKLIIRTTRSADVEKAGLKAGDVVVLEDPDWPLVVQGLPVGTVESVEPRRGAPLFAEIKLSPPVDLLLLRDVWVLTGKTR